MGSFAMGSIFDGPPIRAAPVLLSLKMPVNDMHISLQAVGLVPPKLRRIPWIPEAQLAYGTVFLRKAMQPWPGVGPKGNGLDPAT
jgi:hypothetical protein